MNALVYLVDSLLTIYLYVLILRFVMQLSRADFRNQIAHAVLVVTNPVIMPLRRILPPIGKIDTATVVAIIVFAALTIAAVQVLAGGSMLDPVTWIQLTFLSLLRAFIQFYTFALIIYALLSWVVPAGYSPPMAILGAICDPILAPFRRLIPPIGGIDLSVLWALLLLGVLLRLFHFA
jgi:YggT family protein